MVNLKNAFKGGRVIRATGKGYAGFDNPRENIDPHLKTKVLNSMEGTIEKVPVNNNDIANKAYVDQEVAAMLLDTTFAIINASTNGNNTLVAAVAGKKIRVISLALVMGAATTIRFEDGAGGTALTGQMEIAANSGVVLPYNPSGHFETGVNTLLNLELSGANNADGYLTYIEV